MDNIPAVAGDPPSIITADFVKLTIYNDVANVADTSIYTFSSAYDYQEIDGQVYGPLGGMLQISAQQRDLRATSSQTSISLSGIGSENIYIVLGLKIQGAMLEIIRGFYDSNYILTSHAKRFTGIVTTYNINEDRQGTTDNFTVTLSASSFKTVLESRVSGRKTNIKSWHAVNPTDGSMNNVNSISGQWFDFGVKPGSTSGGASPNPSGAGMDGSLVPFSLNQQ
jgi:hypothetical protein